MKKCFAFIIKYNKNRDYLKELKLSIKRIRKFYNDKIYILNISENFKFNLDFENIEIINHSIDLKEKHPFFSKPFGMYYLESIIKEDIIIHLDCDMYMIDKIKVENFKNLPKCLIYDDFESKSERKFKKYVFNTCIIISRKKDKLYKKWVDIINKNNLSIFTKIIKKLDFEKIEELTFDLLDNINIIENIMFGETYNNIRNKPLNNISFLHYHLDSDYNIFDEYKYFLKYLKFKN